MKKKNTPEKVEILKEKDVKISASSHKLLSEEAKKFKISRKKYLEDAIRFFALRGQNPESFAKNMESNLMVEIKNIKKALKAMYVWQETNQKEALEKMDFVEEGIRILLELFLEKQQPPEAKNETKNSDAK